MVPAYPLQWPVGQARTKKPIKHVRFKGSPAWVQWFLEDEIRKLGGENLIISSNLRLKPNGKPYAQQLTLGEDQGVAVYFDYNDEQMVLACDKWDSVHHNMQAIANSISAMRSLDRWGVSDMLNRAFTGFKALPSHITPRWSEVLGVPETATQEQIRTAYRQKCKDSHPDHGGSVEEFNRVQEAYAAATR